MGLCSVLQKVRVSGFSLVVTGLAETEQSQRDVDVKQPRLVTADTVQVEVDTAKVVVTVDEGPVGLVAEEGVNGLGTRDTKTPTL